MKHDFEPYPTSRAIEWSIDPEQRSPQFGAWFVAGNQQRRMAYTGLFGELTQLAIQAHDAMEDYHERRLDEYFKLRREALTKSYFSPLYAKQGIKDRKEPKRPNMKHLNKKQRKRLRKKLAGARGPYYVDK